MRTLEMCLQNQHPERSAQKVVLYPALWEMQVALELDLGSSM